MLKFWTNYEKKNFFNFEI